MPALGAPRPESKEMGYRLQTRHRCIPHSFPRSGAHITLLQRITACCCSAANAVKAVRRARSSLSSYCWPNQSRNRPHPRATKRWPVRAPKPGMLAAKQPTRKPLSGASRRGKTTTAVTLLQPSRRKKKRMHTCGGKLRKFQTQTWCRSRKKSTRCFQRKKHQTQLLYRAA